MDVDDSTLRGNRAQGTSCDRFHMQHLQCFNKLTATALLIPFVHAVLINRYISGGRRLRNEMPGTFLQTRFVPVRMCPCVFMLCKSSSGFVRIAPG